ncbi:GNAT family N-acetyltransferase [Paludibacterium purpuratum]|uniref:RimJ/RimL family protein N-acetyltransferase n=1 Tax=Paludibacterium purpuratum TaxID=1144873 RepID=A0A4R7B7L3_9NEIS|nr:GNAT family protein [Paludibacterium purpuratum]TDR80701.1 RimJ/RimL family protein N-acetyltransferase [Paludibacterium purpuratum]
MKYDHLGRPLGEEVPNWHGATPPARVTLSGRLCRVEAFDLARHGSALRAVLAPDLDGWTYLAVPPQSEAEWDAWLTGCAQSSDPLRFVIVEQASGEVVGTASYLRIAPQEGAIEVGWLHFSPRMKRTPVATEAMYLMMRQAFEWGYRRYEWKCNRLNAASMRAAERLGFSFEGIFRQARVNWGLNRDTAWFSLLDHEWPSARAALEAWLAPDNFDAQGLQRRTLESLRGR